MHRPSAPPPEFHGHILAAGKYLPKQRVSNDELAEFLPVSGAWVSKTTGIHHRHIASESETVAYMSECAASIALDRAKRTPEDLDLILVATSTGSNMTPAVASSLQGTLGARHAVALQISVGCAGFVHALVVAQQFIATGTSGTVLVVGAERQTPWLDWSDPTTCVLFGDGAGAVILEAGPPTTGILASMLGCDGTRDHLMTVPMPGGFRPPMQAPPVHPLPQPTFRMSGTSVARFATRAFRDSLGAVLSSTPYSQEHLTLVIPHQANPRLIRSVAGFVGLNPDKIFVNADKYGNTSAASIPIALCEALEQGLLREGDLVALSAFGAGLAWGSALIALDGTLNMSGGSY